MRIPFLLFASLSLVSGCAYDALIAEGGCDADASGPKSIFLKYNADTVSIAGHVNVRKKSLFIIKLQASNDFKDTVVTIDGVTGTLPDGGGSTDPDWMDTHDSYNDRKSFVLCVPNVPEGTEYKYTVDIAGLAFRDPRVHVEK